jgi:hypothetical protein
VWQRLGMKKQKTEHKMIDAMLRVLTLAATHAATHADNDADKRAVLAVADWIDALVSIECRTMTGNVDSARALVETSWKWIDELPKQATDARNLTDKISTGKKLKQ